MVKSTAKKRLIFANITYAMFFAHAGWVNTGKLRRCISAYIHLKSENTPWTSHETLKTLDQIMSRLDSSLSTDNLSMEEI